MAGIYDPSGAYRVTVTDGSEVTGIYAPDGSYQVVIQNVAEGELSVDGATGTEPGFSSEVTGDTNSRIFVGLDSADSPMVAMGSGAAAHDTFLKRLAANTLAMINGTSAQALYFYNTFTSGSVFERGFFRWAANVLEIGNEHTGGTNRILRLMGTNGIRLNSGGTDRITVASTAMQPSTDTAMALGTTTARYSNGFFSGHLGIGDTVTAPSATVGMAKIYVDVADGDLKVIFGDGIIKTLATDT